MRIASSKIDFINNLVFLSMSASTVRYSAAPSNVRTTVLDSLVGCGISSSTVAINADAREYLKTLFQGKLKIRHLRAMMYVAIRLAVPAREIIKARYVAASKGVVATEVKT